MKSLSAKPSPPFLQMAHLRGTIWVGGVPVRGFDHIPDSEQSAIIADYLDGMRLHPLREKYKRHQESIANLVYSTVGKQLGRRGGEKNARLITWDYDFFERTEPTTAYWSGFIMADGTINARKQTTQLSIHIHEKDIDHIRKFATALQLSKKELHFNPPNKYGIRLNRLQLAAQMFKWGVVPNKSYTFIEPRVSGDVLVDYLRGWADGDAYISMRCHKERFRLTGNSGAMRWYANALRRVGYKGTVCYEHAPGKVWAKITVNGRLQVTELVSILCPPGSLFLARRWEKVLSRELSV